MRFQQLTIFLQPPVCSTFLKRFLKTRRMTFNGKPIAMVNLNSDKVTIRFELEINSKLRPFTSNRMMDEEVGASFRRILQNIAKFNAGFKDKRKKRLKNEALIDELPDIEIGVEVDGKFVDNSLSHREAWRSGSVLKIGDQRFSVVLNGPGVKSMKLPKQIYQGFPIYLTTELENCDINDCEFRWYKLVSGGKKNTKGDELEKSHADECEIITDRFGKWKLFCNSYFYEGKSIVAGDKLKVICIPKKGEVVGFEVEAVSSTSVLETPFSNIFPFEKRQQETSTKVGDSEFRVVSYNILADVYAETEEAKNSMFAHCQPEYLKFDYRKLLILKEIAGYNSCVLCLQEVDRKFFRKELSFYLDRIGMRGSFCAKDSQADEGIAIYYDINRFELLYEEKVLLKDILFECEIFNEEREKIQKNEKLVSRLSRSTSSLFLFLRCKNDPTKGFFVVSSHLFWAPDADHVRLIQSYIIIKYLNQLLEKMKRQFPEMHISYLVCGDFNSTPPFGVLELFTAGCIKEDHADWKSNADEAIDDLNLFHRLSFSNACGTPEYTNYTVGFKGCLDYIFYDNRSLKVDHVIPMPSHEDVTLYKALPSQLFPSDHIAIGCTLKWI